MQALVVGLVSGFVGALIGARAVGQIADRRLKALERSFEERMEAERQKAVAMIRKEFEEVIKTAGPHLRKEVKKFFTEVEA